MKPSDKPSFPTGLPGGHSSPVNETSDVFVNRLERLIQLRQDFKADLNTLGADLLDRSIYATYRDCIDFGAADRASALMARAGLPTWQPGPKPDTRTT